MAHEIYQLVMLIWHNQSLSASVWAYVCSWENLLDMSLMALSIAYLITLTQAKHIWHASFFPNLTNSTVSYHKFDQILNIEERLQSQTSAMLFVGFLKALDLLKLNPKTYLIADTIRSGCGDLVVFVMFVLANYVFFGVWAHVMFADISDEEQFSSLSQSIYTSVVSVVRNIDFDPLIDRKLYWLVIWQATLYFFAQRILINFVVAVVIHYFDKVKNKFNQNVFTYNTYRMPCRINQFFAF